MIVLRRAQLILLTVLFAALLVGAVVAGVAYRDHIMAWMGAGDGAARSEIQPAARERKILYWYDPMHPQYTSDKPGIAPDCGMRLVPKYAEEDQTMREMPAGTVQISPAKQQLIGVRTGIVARAELTQAIRAVGQVEIDETRTARVHTKVSGWVRRVFVDYTWQHVKKGEPLFTLYSPELVSAQEEYLIARRAQAELGGAPYGEVAAGAERLLRSARERLRLWDVTDEQIAELEVRGSAQEELTFYAPASGHVAERKVFPGQYITPESELYAVVDHSRVWVQVQLYEYEMAGVREGLPVAMSVEAFPGRVFRGHVVFVSPHLDHMARTLPVRLEFDNPELALKPGMYATVEMQVALGRQVVVPREAVIDTGVRQLVFLALPEGYFEPRQIQVGARLGERVAVLSGLKPGETIVTSGTFLIDSESRLKSAMEGMRHQ